MRCHQVQKRLNYKCLVQLRLFKVNSGHFKPGGDYTMQDKESLINGLAVLPPYCSCAMWAQLTGQSESAVKSQAYDGKLAVVDISSNPSGRNRRIMINVIAETKRANDALEQEF